MAKKRLDLGEADIKKLFITFIIPAVIGMLATTTAGLIDSYFIGNFIGSEGIGAITVVVPLLSIAAGVAAMIVSGGVVLAGIAYGKKDLERSNNLFNVTFYMLMITSFLLMAVIWLFGRPIVTNIIGVKGVSLTYALDYLRITTLFIPFFMSMFFFNFFLKLDGFPVVIVIATVIGVLINIVMDYLLVKVYALGMGGAAFATGISQVVPTLLLLGVTLKQSNWTFEKPAFRVSDIKDILFNGSSEFLSLGSVGIAGYIYNLTITKNLGAKGIAAYGIAMQVSSIAIMVFYGISEGIQSIVSYNYGAGKLDRVDAIRNLAFRYSVMIGLLFTGIFVFFGKAVSGIFVADVAIQELSSTILLFFAMATVIAGINLNASTYYTALGQPVKSALLALVRSLFGLVIGLLIFPPLFGTYGVWIPIVFTELVTLVLVIYYIKVAPYGDKKSLASSASLK